MDSPATSSSALAVTPIKMSSLPRQTAAFVWSKDQKYLYVASGGQNVYKFDFTTQKKLGSFGSFFSKHQLVATNLLLSNDEKKLFVMGYHKNITVWDTTTRKKLAVIKGRLKCPFTAAIVTSDDKFIAFNTNRDIFFFDITTCSLLEVRKSSIKEKVRLKTRDAISVKFSAYDVVSCIYEISEDSFFLQFISGRCFLWDFKTSPRPIQDMPENFRASLFDRENNLIYGFADQQKTIQMFTLSTKDFSISSKATLTVPSDCSIDPFWMTPPVLSLRHNLMLFPSFKFPLLMFDIKTGRMLYRFKEAQRQYKVSMSPKETHFIISKALKTLLFKLS